MKRLLRLLQKEIHFYTAMVKEEKENGFVTESTQKLTRLKKLRETIAFDREGCFCTQCIKEFSEEVAAARKLTDFKEALNKNKIVEAVSFASNGERLCERHWNRKLKNKLGHIFYFEEKRTQEKKDMVI